MITNTGEPTQEELVQHAEAKRTQEREDFEKFLDDDDRANRSALAAGAAFLKRARELDEEVADRDARGNRIIWEG